MVTTRGKSLPSYKDQSESDRDDQKHGVGSASDDGSDYEKPVKKKPNPKGKGKSKAPSPATPVRPVALDKFFDVLPLDLVLETFTHLHSIDLLNLACTNKMLRSHLMSKCTSGVWKAARLNSEGPECPLDQSEPQWAKLVFILACTFCGTGTKRSIEWDFRARACHWCSKAFFMPAGAVSRHYRRIEHLETVLQMIPYKQHHDGSTKFYYSGAVGAVGEELESYQTRVEAGAEDAQKELDEFIVNAKAKSQAVRDHAQICRGWERITRVKQAEVEKKKKAERAQAITERLMALGHAKVDIDSIRHISIFASMAQVTDRNWAGSIKRKAERAAIAAKEERLQRELASADRTSEAERLWNDFKTTTTVPPFAPNLDYILTIDPFSSILRRHESLQLTDLKASFDRLKESFPGTIRYWQGKKWHQIIRNSGLPDGTVQDLATTCFTCQHLDVDNQGPVIHWSTNIDIHTVHDVSPTCLQFNQKTSQAIRVLVQMMGLDPDSVKPWRVDAAHVRVQFACKLCEYGGDGVKRDWRDLARHFDLKHPLDHPTYTHLQEEARVEVAEAAVKVEEVEEPRPE